MYMALIVLSVVVFFFGQNNTQEEITLFGLSRLVLW